VLTMLTVLTQKDPLVRREFGYDARQWAPPWGESGVARRVPDDYVSIHEALIRTLFVRREVGWAAFPGTQANFTDNRVH
jgi:hypothetical protein